MLKKGQTLRFTSNGYCADLEMGNRQFETTFYKLPFSISFLSKRTNANAFFCELLSYDFTKKNLLFCLLCQCGNYGNLLSRQKFRESNVFTKQITKELIWWKIFGESKFLIFPHFALLNFWKIISRKKCFIFCKSDVKMISQKIFQSLCTMYMY